MTKRARAGVVASIWWLVLAGAGYYALGRLYAAGSLPATHPSGLAAVLYGWEWGSNGADVGFIPKLSVTACVVLTFAPIAMGWIVAGAIALSYWFIRREDV